ncbi:hypothetical protein SAMN02745206_02260 [Desulfacinum infernum DSM 9756]|uniref:Uncharacterized protein n=1 Tax=Desulfacinum infernum DSM 9756 TaxID=1121391 RepID=A0A1M5CRZ4_9BACT|nr:hypothetical protein [Desulfacinum infernum]SHF57495.1 hypothetical protein SAMN02745206_02260 [Desulfacinum infernum DSM 9756]
MEKNKVLDLQLDFLKGSDIGKEGLQAHDVLDPTAPNTTPVEKDATANAENDVHDRKLREKIDRSMDAVKEFIRNIDINRL